MMVRCRSRYLAQLLAIGAACGCRPAPANVAPAASPGSAATAARAPLVVDLRGTQLSVAGRPVAAEAVALQRALFAFAPGAALLELRGHVGDDEQTLRPVLRELAHGPVPNVRVLTELRIDLRSRLRSDAAAGSLISGFWRDGGIVLQTHGQWLARFTPGDGASEATAADAIKQACWPGPCRAALTLDAEAPLVAPLNAWQRVVGSVPTTLNIQTRPATEAAHVPPATVQHTVRDHFPTFRACYDSGRIREPNLLGDVIVRFVLGEDGKASQVINDGGNLPDDYTVRCVLRAFEQLTFPRPEAGPLVIEYPIAFTPAR